MTSPPAARPVVFESYGAVIGITGNDTSLIDQALAVAKVSLLGRLKPSRKTRYDHTFELNRSPSGSYVLIRDGHGISSGRSRRKFLKFFDAMIRVTVGEASKELLFIHAGVVGWK